MWIHPSSIAEQDIFGIKYRRRLRAIVKEVEQDPYDPRKPEYTIPTSTDEYERMTLQWRHQQAQRLESAVAARKADGSVLPRGVLEHYTALAEDLRCDRCIPGVPDRASTFPAPRTEPVQCPICLEGPDRAMLLVLACGHPLCSNCSAKCAAAGLNACPVCRFPHILDPVCLAQRKEQWRTQYGQWRLGQANGAHGEVSVVHEPKKLMDAAHLEYFPEAIQAIPLHELLGWKREDKLEVMTARLAAHPVLTGLHAGDLILRTWKASTIQQVRAQVTKETSAVGPVIQQRAAPRREGGLSHCLLGISQLMKKLTAA